MTIERFQGIVLRVSNFVWCRHWVHFNAPQSPAKMAIQILDLKPGSETDRPQWQPRLLKDLENYGFELLNGKHNEGDKIYTIARTNEDGTPYESKL